MAYRYLGSATTNANGVAELNFTGTGRGELDIVASTSNPPSGSSLVSETYSLWDTFTYDGGTTGTANDIWDISKCTLNRGTEYSEITETEEYGFIRTKQANAIPKDCIMEFDFMNVDGAVSSNVFGIYTDSLVYVTIINLGYLGNLSVGAWHHIKVKIENNRMTVTNTTNSTVYTKDLTISTSKILFLFLTTGDTTKTRFKNFKAYPV